MSLEDFDRACKSLAGYWGVVGIFGGSPTLHPHFTALRDILRHYFPDVGYIRRSDWSCLYRALIMKNCKGFFRD